MERGFAVHSINPKQLDRSRDRAFASGCEGRPPRCLGAASALRTDPYCLRRLSATLGGTGVVAAGRGFDVRAYAAGEPDARAAVAVLRAVSGRGGRHCGSLLEVATAEDRHLLHIDVPSEGVVNRCRRQCCNGRFLLFDERHGAV